MNNIKSYLDTVCEQIRFQKAHDFVKKELQDHISDQTNAFIEQGISEKEAIQKAIQEMGDPVLVGTELDRVHRPEMKWSYIVFVLLFSLSNLLLRFILETQAENYHFSLLVNFMSFDVIFTLTIGIAVMIAVCYIDFTILAVHAKMIYMIYVIVMALLWYYIMHYYTVFRYGVYYITETPFLIKIPHLIYIYTVVLVGLLYNCRGKSYGAISLCIASFFIPAYFAFGNASYSAVYIVGLISLLLIITAIIKGWFAVNKGYAVLFVCIFSALLFLFFMTFLAEPHTSSVIDSDFLEYYKAFFQQTRKGAVLLGEGQKMITLPFSNGEIRTVNYIFQQEGEYITSNALHYFGWIPFLLFLGGYLFFVIKGIVSAQKQKGQLASMTAFAILLLFLFVGIWNVIFTSGIFTEYLYFLDVLEFPFFSNGESIDVVCFLLMGILLSVFRTGKYENIQSIKKKEEDLLE